MILGLLQLLQQPIFIAFEVMDLITKVYSTVTGRTYEPTECLYITNYQQASAYMQHGAVLYDVLARERTLTFVFTKNDTRELYRRWKEKTL